MLLRPLPYPHADRLYAPVSMRRAWHRSRELTFADYEDWRREICIARCSRAGWASRWRGWPSDWALAVPAARLLGQLLYATSAFDPTAFAGTATLLAIVAFVACLIPARRAAVADPLAALRSE